MFVVILPLLYLLFQIFDLFAVILFCHVVIRVFALVGYSLFSLFFWGESASINCFLWYIICSLSVWCIAGIPTTIFSKSRSYPFSLPEDFILSVFRVTCKPSISSDFLTHLTLRCPTDPDKPSLSGVWMNIHLNSISHDLGFMLTSILTVKIWFPVSICFANNSKIF